jgi:hypothetical protein
MYAPLRDGVIYPSVVAVVSARFQVRHSELQARPGAERDYPHVIFLHADVLCLTQVRNGIAEEETDYRLGKRAEMNKILRAVRQSERKVVYRHDVATPAALKEAVSGQGCTVLHITCHGMDYDFNGGQRVPGKKSHPKYLLFEPDDKTYAPDCGILSETGSGSQRRPMNGGVFVKPKAFTGDMKNSDTRLRLVFLACCHGEAFGRQCVAAKTGTDDGGAGIPHVICTHAAEKIDDVFAADFEELLFRFLFSGKGVESAFNLAKEELRKSARANSDSKSGSAGSKQAEKYLHLWAEGVDKDEILFPDIPPLQPNEEPILHFPTMLHNLIYHIPALTKQTYSLAEKMCRALVPPSGDTKQKLIVLTGAAQAGKSVLANNVLARCKDRGAHHTPVLGGVFWLDLEGRASVSSAIQPGDAFQLKFLESKNTCPNDGELIHQVADRLQSNAWKGKRILLGLHGSHMDLTSDIKQTIHKLIKLKRVQVACCMFFFVLYCVYRLLIST